MKAKITKISTLLAFGIIGLGYSQISFTNANTKLHSDAGVAGSNNGVHNNNSVLVVDVDNNGLDDIVKIDENRNVQIEYQQGNGNFNWVNYGSFTGTNDSWGCSMADMDHNGYKDILFAPWGSTIQVMKINNMTGGFTILNLVGTTASQNVNFMDINNDSWADIFVCNDVGPSLVWTNNTTGGYTPGSSLIDFNVTPGTAAPNDESGNYGSVWSDYNNDGFVDLYIIHCRQGQPAGDLRRTNVLFKNTGTFGPTSYVSSAAAHGLASNEQDWTGAFGDIDNDGDFDLLLTGHESSSHRVFTNSGAPSYNFTETTTVNFGSFAQQGQFVDFDNDGFVDIIITGGDLQKIHRNNGNGTFTEISNTTLGFTSSDILSFASGDLNHDGKIDLYTSYGSVYNNVSSSEVDILWMNNTNNDNHFLELNLVGTASNDDALGARAYIYGAWGVQTREVRASESYGTLNSFQLHFGLGSATTIDSVVINWPATGSPNTVIIDPAVDQTITIIEGTCVSPEALVVPTGSGIICPGGDVTLNASLTGAGYSYLWSNGATTPSITVSSTGDYSVQVTQTGNACKSWSPIFTVVNSPDETPSVSVTGDLEFCPGGSVTLTSSETSGNTWSNGATTNSIVVTTSGTYHVTYAGACQNWNSSDVTVNVLAAPAPTSADQYSPTPTTFALTATGTGTQKTWYDAPTGGTLLFTGNTYNTPLVSVTDTFYVQDQFVYGGGTDALGMLAWAGTSRYSGATTNAHLIFNVMQPCTLNTVRVRTDTPGNRTVELRNASGTVLQSLTFDLDTGSTTLTLDFPLAVGVDYQLGTNTAMNNTTLGTNSPRLERSNNNTPVYPYNDASGAISITNSSQGASVYYYYYDWQITIDASNICNSARTPVRVQIGNASIENADEYQMEVYPNPATDVVNIDFTTLQSSDVTFNVYDMLGKKVITTTAVQVDGHYVQPLNIASLASGVYNVEIMIDGKSINTRIIKK